MRKFAVSPAPSSAMKRMRLPLFLYQLAVAREHAVSRFQCAAEIAVVPDPGAADWAAEGAAADAA
jgi:hypothetical protein